MAGGCNSSEATKSRTASAAEKSEPAGNQDGKGAASETKTRRNESFAELLVEALQFISVGSGSRDVRVTARFTRKLFVLRRQFQAPVFLAAAKALLESAYPSRVAQLEAALDHVPRLGMEPSYTDQAESRLDTVQCGEDSTTNPPISAPHECGDGTTVTLDTDDCAAGCSNEAADVEMMTDVGSGDDGAVTAAATAGSTANSLPAENADPQLRVNGIEFILTSISGMRQLTPDALEGTYYFLSTLALIVLVDHHWLDKADPIAKALVEDISSWVQSSKRCDSTFIHKAIFHVSRAFELRGEDALLRPLCMRLYRQAVLHRQTMTQALCLNVLLRSLLLDNLYDQAIRLLEKTQFPEDLRSNSQSARYLYYLARINAVRLNYKEAFANISQAVRKAPQCGSCFGRGFRVVVYKLLFIIQLLMGSIPDCERFQERDMRSGGKLLPYMQIVQSVRAGDRVTFQGVMSTHEEEFVKDGNLILIQRLQHNVIRAGLRRICASYSRISLADVAAKLRLESTDDAEGIVAKAIADGVIDAQVDSDAQTIISSVSAPVDRPMKTYNNRISFCLQLHNEAIKAMQYPEPEVQSRIEEATQRRKEHQEHLARVIDAEADEYDGPDI